MTRQVISGKPCLGDERLELLDAHGADGGGVHASTRRVSGGRGGGGGGGDVGDGGGVQLLRLLDVAAQVGIESNVRKRSITL